MSEYKLIVEKMLPSGGFLGLGRHDGTGDFQVIVNQHLADGWTCQGGVCVMVVGDKVAVLMQAMTR